ncbi:MAG: reverse transcriptase/maturase family protein [Candidatus Promineifilaceae bacterium]
MKTYRNLYPQISTFSNLLVAFYKARQGKRGKFGVAAFEYELERELLRLERELQDETWRPGGYTSFYITEPKRRKISAAPFRDRVVHHALINMTGPIYERQFIHDSYANRVGKGTHRAMDRCTHFLRGHRFVLKADIAQFFPSVDHAVLRGILARPLRDESTLRLIDLILASGTGILASEYTPHWFPQDFTAGQGNLLAVMRPRGLPIGNLTSQFWANVLLNELDQYIKRELKCQAYIRYVDDFLLFHDDKTQLHTWKTQIATFLEKLRLQLHPQKSVVFPTRLGVEFLGFRHFATHRRLRSGNGRRFQHKLRRLVDAYTAGDLPLEKVNQSVQSWVAHAAHGDTWHLRQTILGSVRLPAPTVGRGSTT